MSHELVDNTPNVIKSLETLIEDIDQYKANCVEYLKNIKTPMEDRDIKTFTAAGKAFFVSSHEITSKVEDVFRQSLLFGGELKNG